MCVMARGEVRSRGSEMGGGGGGGGEPRVVKREPGSRRNNREEVEEKTRGGETGETSDSGGRQDVMERRVLRSRYHAMKNLINDEKEDIARVDSDRFNSIIGEVESLHELVKRPREQVADAEALLDIASTLTLSVKSYGHDGVTPGDFVTSVLRNFGQQNGVASAENLQSVDWGDLGVTVSHIFTKGPGCCTMLGPMDTEMKQRRTGAQRRRERPAESARPEDLNRNKDEERTDTDMNMLTMFNVLRKKRSVRLENLILNRNSFAQTVENLFALSFLVKDGRAEIAVDDNGCHFVAPKNAPAANAVMSGNASYNHFVFRLDFKDWKLMMDSVTNGEELMPHRNRNISDSQEDQVHDNSQGGAPTTPIRKLCRNRGLVIQEQSVVEDSPENDNSTENAAATRKGKRKLQQ